MGITRSYQKYATIPSAIISDGILPIPVWAVSNLNLTSTYKLPPIGSSGAKAIVSAHDDSISMTGVLVGAERFAWKYSLETLAETSKSGGGINAYTGGLVGGLIVITSLTIRTDLQIESLSFTVSSAKRDTIDVIIKFAHMPRPSVLGKILDVSSLGVAALADWAGN